MLIVFIYFKNQGNPIPIIHKCKYYIIIRIQKLVQIKRHIKADYYNVIPAVEKKISGSFKKNRHSKLKKIKNFNPIKILAGTIHKIKETQFRCWNQ